MSLGLCVTLLSVRAELYQAHQRSIYHIKYRIYPHLLIKIKQHSDLKYEKYEFKTSFLTFSFLNKDISVTPPTF